MLDFLDATSYYFIVIFILFILVFIFSLIAFFGIKGIEWGSFEYKERSVENILIFIKKKSIQMILGLILMSITMILFINISFRKGTFEKIKEMYQSNDYVIYEIGKNNFENLNLDFSTFILIDVDRYTLFNENDNISFTIKNDKSSFDLKLKQSSSDTLLYYVFIENYHYTSYEPYASIRKRK